MAPRLLYVQSVETRVAILALLCAACSVPTTSTNSDAPAIGTADSADHGCKVVLRVVQRTTLADGGYETDCSTSPCTYVWRGSVDVDDGISTDAEVGVLYHRASDPMWWDATASWNATVNPGFHNYTFVLRDHLFGPDDAGETIEVVPYLRVPGAGRLFDHNRYARDFENYQLTSNFAFTASDGGVCPPDVGSVSFFDNFTDQAFGARHEGGYLRVNYEIARLPQCRGTHNGYPAWDIVANARFSPGGQTFQGSVRSIVTNMGTPTNDATDQPWTVEIPDDATGVDLWFHNFTGAGSNCEAWDSNYGANYHFDIWPHKDDVRCKDVELRNGTNGEDHRMYFADPYCVPYSLATQSDARACEVSLDGIGHGMVGHYGIPFEWLLVYLRTQGDVQAAGLYTHWHDAGTGVSGQRFSLGRKVADDVWETGFAYHIEYPYGPNFQHTIDDFAFFADVRQPSGQVVRVWQSHGGANYRWDDAFTLPTTNEGISYGTIQWANQSASIYGARCR